MSKIVKIILVVVFIVGAGWLIYSSTSVRPSSKTDVKQKVIGAIYNRQNLDAFNGLKDGMKKLGYTDKNIVYDEVLIIPGPNLVDDLTKAVQKIMADKVDVLFVSDELIAQIALDLTKKAGSDLPIVFTTRFHDPLSYGLIQSYKSSGNNSTGVATNLIESIQKTLLFFKEINPNAKKIGAFTEGFMIPGGSDQILSELRNQISKFGLTLVEYKTSKAPDPTIKNWKEVADTIKPGDIDGLIHLPVHFYDPQEVDETLLANRLRIPHSAPSEDLPTGGSFAFSDDFHASASQAAVMIQKIFNGAKPQNIPIEFGTKSLLILNLKRAQDAGFKFPDSMLSIAQVKIDK